MYKQFSCNISEIADYLNNLVKQGYSVLSYTVHDVAYGVEVIVKVD